MSQETSQASISRRTNLQTLTNRTTINTSNNSMAKYSLIDTSTKTKDNKDIVQDLLPPDDEDDINNISNNSTNVQELIESTTSTLDEAYEKELEATKIRHWNDSEFAVGCVEITWNDELQVRGDKCNKYRNSNKDSCCVCCCACCQEDIDPTCGCLYLSGMLCSKFKSIKRVGNMIVLKESIELVDDAVEGDEEQHQSNTANTTISSHRKKVERRNLELVVGPFWPMMLCVTYPIIFSVSSWTCYTAFLKGNKPFLVFLFWFSCTFGLIFSLFQVAFRDPGILRRHRTIPKNVPTSGSMRSPSWWKWSDAALTYRPYGALYDPDCACVIEGFDHTCPWTGTAIGNKNMAAFQSFIALVFICLIMDILLLTGLFERS